MKEIELNEVQVFKEEYYYKENIGTFKTILVEGSNSGFYDSLMECKPRTEGGRVFKRNLKIAIDAGVKTFRVPINDPSIDRNYGIHFAHDCYPAVGYPYRQLEIIARENNIRLGTKNEYCLFLGTMILRLIAEGWTKHEAWDAICNDSNALGNYWDSKEAKHDLELTGSRKIAGKCDLANTCKVLAKDESGVVWIAGGDCICYGAYAPLARFRQLYDINLYYGVGWYVFDIILGR